MRTLLLPCMHYHIIIKTNKKKRTISKCLWNRYTKESAVVISHLFNYDKEPVRLYFLSSVSSIHRY